MTTQVPSQPSRAVAGRVDDRRWFEFAGERVAVCERALEPKKPSLIAGGHFDPYLSGFEQYSAAARAWFRQHLGD